MFYTLTVLLVDKINIMKNDNIFLILVVYVGQKIEIFFHLKVSKFLHLT